jgi:predicted nucleic acid-binding protein
MRFVLDSSVGFKTLVAETDSGKAQQLYDNCLKGIHELLAPDVFSVEVAHSITRAERQARITPAQGARLLTDILNRLPQMHPSLPLLPRAYAISSTARIGVYDCLYLALAEREGCEFVTADDKLVKNLRGQFPIIVALASMP